MAIYTDSKNEVLDNEDILDFPVVGIGASAGGLEALQEFFSKMPSKPGAAFVIVQHLSPDYKSLMDELLARYTNMPINVVKDGMEVCENNVYLIPPKVTMEIHKGKLYLTALTEKRSLNLPIDVFFRSLAKDQEKNAIAIILSGTGSDGTLGIRSVKEMGGIIMVQDDRSAKFDGMPRSSISTGLVDFILPADKLAEELVVYIKHPFVKSKNQIENLLNTNQNSLAKVIAILRDEKGVDFGLYKQNTVIRRLEKRISINRFDNIEEYLNYLSDNPKEANILFNEFLIGVTRFFRDTEAFNKLKDKIIPQIINNTGSKQEIRIWVAACSTGEEAYSIAMLFKEYMDESSNYKEIKIFATDLDTKSLEFAGAGFYPESIVSDVTPERLAKYFTKRDSGYQINENIRSMIIFARHNLMQDPPFSKIDLISCRNLLIYLNADVQQKVLSMFYLSLNPNSFLFLGSSESLGNLADGFQIIDSKNKLFRMISDYKPEIVHNYGASAFYRGRNELKSLSTTLKNIKPKPKLLEGIIDDILADYIPPSVIIDERHEVIHTIHNVSNYISLPIGQVSLNLMKMLTKDLAIAVNSLIRRCSTTESKVVIENIKISDNDQQISISCKKLINRNFGDTFYLISFIENIHQDRPSKMRKVESIELSTQYQERIEELEKDLQFKSESLQATVEELETSNEELQSSNEELIASNEELQSTNEELQSVNEELYTVNSEHIKKIEELTELNADMDNLLKNTRVGNLFLDRELNIRKVNEVASRITNILPTDRGRPIYHLSAKQLYNKFIDDVKSVIQTLQPVEREINVEDSEVYFMKIIPYRTSENAVNGIIITFIDITKLQQSRELVDSLRKRLENALLMGEMAWWEWDYEQNIVATGKGKYEMLGYKSGEIGNSYQDWTSLIHPDDLPRAMHAMEEYLQGICEYYFVEYRIKAKDGSYIWYRDKGGIIEYTDEGTPKNLVGIVMNINKEKTFNNNMNSKLQSAQSEMVKSDLRYHLLFNSMKHGVVFQNAEGEIVDINPAAISILGVNPNIENKLDSNSEQWQALDSNKNPFPGDEHPSMVALKTRKSVDNVIMGVYNPKKQAYVWIKVNAIPVFDSTGLLTQVFTMFKEIDIKDLNNA